MKVDTKYSVYMYVSIRQYVCKYTLKVYIYVFR